MLLITRSSFAMTDSPSDASASLCSTGRFIVGMAAYSKCCSGSSMRRMRALMKSDACSISRVAWHEGDELPDRNGEPSGLRTTLPHAV